MAANLAADAVLLLHAAFIVFVVAGGLIALRWPLAAAVHLPCAVWGAAIEFTGGICPLTPLEQRLRAAAGEAGYSGGFIEHYVVPLIYPAGLTPTVQLVLGSAVILVNLAVYGFVLRRRRAGRRGS
ncbi:DUF2784 domain-containing protein [Lentisalinibacter salinarum]|uniref:DUF2784 domain-containing protein n=1 Tax=Lentisalinibacter salinarum TaxID=2992239 RepID=UPI0038702095